MAKPHDSAAARKAKPDEGDKRECILSAALEVFAAKGYHGATMPELADKAGVGAGTVYRYFASKEALVNALFQRWKSLLGVTLMSDFPLDKPVRQQFQEIWHRLVGFADRHPRALEFLEMHHHGDYLDADSHRVEEALLEPLRVYVQKGQAEEVIKRTTPELLGALVYGAFIGIISAGKKGHLRVTPAIWREAEQCLWEAVRR